MKKREKKHTLFFVCGGCFFRVVLAVAPEQHKAFKSEGLLRANLLLMEAGDPGGENIEVK